MSEVVDFILFADDINHKDFNLLPGILNSEMLNNGVEQTSCPFTLKNISIIYNIQSNIIYNLIYLFKLTTMQLNV